MQTYTIDDLIQQRGKFLSFVRRRVDSQATAEDILQSAYIRAMEQCATLHKNESAAAWFYRILRNAVIDYYRHRAVEDRSLEQLAREHSSEPLSMPEEEAATCECIGEVLDTMKPAYSQAIREVDLAEDTLQNFAGKTGISAGNAAVRIHRARQSLRKHLTRLCGACAKDSCLHCTCS